VLLFGAEASSRFAVFIEWECCEGTITVDHLHSRVAASFPLPDECDMGHCKLSSICASNGNEGGNWNGKMGTIW
jgi:hypothetical protein